MSVEIVNGIHFNIFLWIVQLEQRIQPLGTRNIQTLFSANCFFIEYQPIPLKQNVEFDLIKLKAPQTNLGRTQGE